MLIQHYAVSVKIVDELAGIKRKLDDAALNN
jgi:hypothetical protein